MTVCCDRVLRPRAVTVIWPRCCDFALWPRCCDCTLWPCAVTHCWALCGRFDAHFDKNPLASLRATPARAIRRDVAAVVPLSSSPANRSCLVPIFGLSDAVPRYTVDEGMDPNDYNSVPPVQGGFLLFSPNMKVRPALA